MADSKTAIAITLVHEGGFQKDPGDPGNWTGGFVNGVGAGELKGTKYGISARQFPNLNIETLTEENAIDIYTRKYWNAFYDHITNQALANKIFDLGVLFGVSEAVTIIQTILSLPVIDGVFGTHTLESLNEAEPVSFLQAYKTAFVTHAIGVANARPSERGDLPGWITRINS